VRGGGAWGGGMRGDLQLVDLRDHGEESLAEGVAAGDHTQLELQLRTTPASMPRS
jgi:hypothetical protein